MRADRLMSALLLLQARGRMTGRELAEELEVSERTIHRDMEALSAAGVPVYANRGPLGGWQLHDDWRADVPGLNEAELLALLMAQPRGIGESHLAADGERALAKLMASLPENLREQAVKLRTRLHVDTSEWGGREDDLEPAQPEHQTAHGDEPLERELKADEEHQEHDAELGDAGNARGVGNAHPVEERCGRGERA